MLPSSDPPTPPGVHVTEPPRAKHERLPSDLLRLLIALVVLFVGWLLATTFDDVAAGFAVGIVRTVDVFANPMIVSAVLALRLAALLLPLLMVPSTGTVSPGTRRIESPGRIRKLTNTCAWPRRIFSFMPP